MQAASSWRKQLDRIGLWFGSYSFPSLSIHHTKQVFGDQECDLSLARLSLLHSKHLPEGIHAELVASVDPTATLPELKRRTMEVIPTRAAKQTRALLSRSRDVISRRHER
jgi:hypothetical protein